MKNVFFSIILFIAICLNIVLTVKAAEEKLIILDASLSMNQPINGVPKYTIAIQAAKDEINKLSPGERIGLRTIGLPLDSALLSFLANPSELCKATQLVAPIRSYNSQNIEAALNSVMPLGTTPLTYSLDTAIKYDFMQGTHTKHIILITDGGESCNENPCEYIKNLSTTRPDILIDVIAIGVNGEPFGQLKCLTEHTSGRIISANTSKEIQDAFSKILNPVFDNSFNNNSNLIKNNYIKPFTNTSEVTYRNYLFETYD